MATLLETINATIIAIIAGQVSTTTIALPGGQQMVVTALDLDKLRLMRRELQAEADQANYGDTTLGVFSMRDNT